jgi:protein-tyrosine phosphatase
MIEFNRGAPRGEASLGAQGATMKGGGFVPATTPARLVTLQGGANFRDLGGYRTAGGGQVRWGRVYRSAALHRLTEGDVATIRDLDLCVVFDLRTDEERVRAPSILPEGLRRELLPIGETAAKTKELTDLVLEGNLGGVPPDFLMRIYESMVENSAFTFGRLLTRLAEVDNMPALFHCTAGKDRTGISAALLLSVLAVDDATILDDYELSGVHYTELQIARLKVKLENAGIDADRYRTVFGAPRDAMAALLAPLRERYGSAESYLREEAGVPVEVFPELRARLVEAPHGA